MSRQALPGSGPVALPEGMTVIQHPTRSTIARVANVAADVLAIGVGILFVVICIGLVVAVYQTIQAVV